MADKVYMYIYIYNRCSNCKIDLCHC